MQSHENAIKDNGLLLLQKSGLSKIFYLKFATSMTCLTQKYFSKVRIGSYLYDSHTPSFATRDCEILKPQGSVEEVH